MTNPLDHLQRLYLKGPLQKFPRWISSLSDLMRIRLKWSSLAENPIPALQNLPHLVELQLLHAYTGIQLKFESRKFPQLKILDLQQLEQLSSIVMEEGVRAPSPGPLRRGVVPLTGYRGMSHALFFRLRESSNPRPKGHIVISRNAPLNC